MNLNKEQLNFCQDKAAFSRLLAPAGCGKTQSLLHRCDYLSKENPQNRYLIITFTKAACDELKDRLISNSDFQKISGVTNIYTLNSWGYRRIKQAKHSLKLVVNNNEKHWLLHNTLQPVWSKYQRMTQLLKDKSGHYKTKAIVELFDLLCSLGFRHDKIKDSNSLNNHINWLNDSGMSFHVEKIFKQLVDLELIQSEKNRVDEFFKHFLKFWASSMEHLYSQALITMDGQKYWAWLDIEKQIESGRFVTGAAKYSHIFVDEFQDINPLDLKLLIGISRLHNSDFTIVGDDDQAIYEWRGASPDFILNPDKYLGKNFNTHILAKNYRSPKNIVEISQNLISKNKKRVPKSVKAVSNDTASIMVKPVNDLNDAIDFVLEQINADIKHNSIAILGRKRSQIIPYQIVFASKDISFYAAEDLHVFLSKTFNGLKDILIIKALSNQSSLIAGNAIDNFIRLCSLVKKYPLSKADKESVTKFLNSKRPKKLVDVIECFKDYDGKLKGENKNAQMTQQFYNALIGFINTTTVSQTIESLSSFEGLQKDYGKSIEDIFYVDPPFLHLSEYSLSYGDNYEGFLDDIEKAVQTLAKIPPVDDTEEVNKDWKKPLHLMTALRAKGKEFDTVIILDCNNGIWPMHLAETPDQLEQERRLFYVAVTRAKKKLIFIVDKKILGKNVSASPYISEMGL